MNSNKSNKLQNKDKRKTMNHCKNPKTIIRLFNFNKTE